MNYVGQVVQAMSQRPDPSLLTEGRSATKSPVRTTHSRRCWGVAINWPFPKLGGEGYLLIGGVAAPRVAVVTLAVAAGGRCSWVAGRTRTRRDDLLRD